MINSLMDIMLTILGPVTMIQAVQGFLNEEIALVIVFFIYLSLAKRRGIAAYLLAILSTFFAILLVKVNMTYWSRLDSLIFSLVASTNPTFRTIEWTQRCTGIAYSIIFLGYAYVTITISLLANKLGLLSPVPGRTISVQSTAAPAEGQILTVLQVAASNPRTFQPAVSLATDQAATKMQAIAPSQHGSLSAMAQVKDPELEKEQEAVASRRHGKRPIVNYITNQKNVVNTYYFAEDGDYVPESVEESSTDCEGETDEEVGGDDM